MRGQVKKMPHTRVSFAITEDMKIQLDKMAVKLNVSSSELIRRFVSQGMGIEKTKDDIDFIRKQLRDELEIAFEKRMSRIIKLLIKIGSMTYPMAYYNAMLGAAMSARHKLNYHEMIEDAKKEGARYLGVANEAVDLAFEEISQFNIDV